jgi:hypothetical protein
VSLMAKLKRCSNKGCTNHSVKGGVCVTHGAKVTHKRCSHEGCTKSSEGRILFHAWRKAEMMNPKGIREGQEEMYTRR